MICRRFFSKADGSICGSADLEILPLPGEVRTGAAILGGDISVRRVSSVKAPTMEIHLGARANASLEIEEPQGLVPLLVGGHGKPYQRTNYFKLVKWSWFDYFNARLRAFF